MTLQVLQVSHTVELIDDPTGIASESFGRAGRWPDRYKKLVIAVFPVICILNLSFIKPTANQYAYVLNTPKENVDIMFLFLI